MKATLKPFTRSLLALFLFVLAGNVTAAERVTAREILDATGVRGGLLVHRGSGDGKLTAALQTLAYLTDLVGDKDTTIHRLQQIIFGATT